MQYLLSGLQTEWLKTRRTFIVWYVILCPFILAALVFLVFLAKPAPPEHITAKVAVNHWESLLTGGYMTLTNLFLVLFIVLLNTMLYAREHQGNMWKHLYSLPIPRWSVFAAKSLFAVLLIGVSLLFYVLFLHIAAYTLDVVRPIYHFSATDNLLGKHLVMVARIYIGLLGIWAIHNWLSLRFKGMGLSMGIAIFSIVATPFVLQGAEKMKDWIYVYPYLYPFHAVLDFMAKDTLYNFWQPEMYGSVLYAVAFTLLGYWEYNRNRHK